MPILFDAARLPGELFDLSGIAAQMRRSALFERMNIHAETCRWGNRH